MARSQHSKYPTLSALSGLRNLPDGAIVFVRGMTLNRAGDTYTISDGDTHLPISNLPDSLKGRMSNSPFHSGLIGVDLHIHVYYVSDYDYYSSWRSKVEYRYYEPKPSRCTCGAGHTFMYNHHSHWCDSNTLE